MPLWWPLLLASLLFSIGVYGVLVRRNAVLVLMGVELMLNAANLNLVAFDAQLRGALHGGQTFALFVIVLAAAEVGLALAIVLMVFRTHGHVDLDRLRSLADRDAPDPTRYRYPESDEYATGGIPMSEGTGAES